MEFFTVIGVLICINIIVNIVIIAAVYTFYKKVDLRSMMRKEKYTAGGSTPELCTRVDGRLYCLGR